MILVDTSVWLDFLVGRETPFRRELRALIERGAEIVVTGLILQEILQGMRSDLDLRRTGKYLLEFRYLSLNETGDYLLAAEIYRTCRRKGKTIRKSADCLIAAQAIGAGAEIFHNDRDFDRIGEVFPLRTYKLPPD